MKVSINYEIIISINVYEALNILLTYVKSSADDVVCRAVFYAISQICNRFFQKKPVNYIFEQFIFI